MQFDQVWPHSGLHVWSLLPADPSTTLIEQEIGKLLVLGIVEQDFLSPLVLEDLAGGLSVHHLEHRLQDLLQVTQTVAWSGILVVLLGGVP